MKLRRIFRYALAFIHLVCSSTLETYYYSKEMFAYSRAGRYKYERGLETTLKSSLPLYST